MSGFCQIARLRLGWSRGVGLDHGAEEGGLIALGRFANLSSIALRASSPRLVSFMQQS
jgi:hypothetical protein